MYIWVKGHSVVQGVSCLMSMGFAMAGGFLKGIEIVGWL